MRISLAGIVLGSLLTTTALPALAAPCDGSEVVCIDLSSQAEVQSSGGQVAGGVFESGGFRPTNNGGIDWQFGPAVDLSAGRMEIDVTGLVPVAGGELEGGKVAIFTAEGQAGSVVHGLQLQKMDESYRDGHIFRFGMDDDGLADNWDSVIITGSGFSCGVFSIADWEPSETHHFAASWSDQGLSLTIDGFQCSSGGNGDTFDPPNKTFTLGNRVQHYANQHADAVFSSFRLWADGTGETTSPPTAQIDAIGPNPATQATDTVSFEGSAFDNDDNGESIEAYEWSSSLDGDLGSAEDISVPASSLSLGQHVITFRVQDDEGEWGEAFGSLTVIEEASTTVTVQLSPLHDAKVAWGEKGDADTNYGLESDLFVGGNASGEPDEKSYFKFDLSQIVGTIESATLRLHCFNSGDAQEVFETSSDLTTGSVWTETNLTWNTAPAATGPVLDTVAGIEPDNVYAFDVTAAAHPGQVMSLVFESTLSNGGGYKSKEHEDAADRPVLDLVYVPGTVPDAGTQTDSGATDSGWPPMDAGSDSDSSMVDGASETTDSGKDATASGARDTPSGGDDGCACGIAGNGRGAAWLWMALGVLILAARRIRM